MKPVVLLAAIAALAACSPKPAATKPAAIAPVAAEVPAGDYDLDKAHASLIFRVSHIGMSRFAKRFTRFDAHLKLDPKHPEAASVTADIDPASIQTDYPDKSFDFNGMLTGPDWLDVKTYPSITFRSTSVRMTGPNTAEVTGDLSLHGVTKPIVLKATFNGGYASNPLDPNSRIGFSATGTFKRSDFGMGYGVPKPGTTMGVGDEVEVLIETEFLRPAAPKS